MRAKDKELKGKVAIVTGASRGIGKAIALALADEGAKVVVAARTLEENGPLKGSIVATADEIKSRGGSAMPVQTNVADEESVEKTVQQVMAELGRIDIMVNNAATNIPRLFKDLTIKQWDIITKVTLRSVVVCSKAVLPAMMTQKYGHIINVSSIAAVTFNDPFTGLAYDVSKAGINRLTVGLARELKEFNIAVNAVMPKNTATDGWVMLNPGADKSDWQTPDMWGKIVTFIATREPSGFTGGIHTADAIRPEMVKAGWKI